MINLGHLKKFKFIEINGMRMTTPKQVYSAIWSQLTGEKRTADHASELLEEKFGGNSRGRAEPILMIVDELDQLMTRTGSTFILREGLTCRFPFVDKRWVPTS